LIKQLPVHWLSKDARYRIVDLLLSTRSVRQLAMELGVSPTAIRKYINRVTHPSDETMKKILEIVAPYEEEKVVKIITDDMIEAIYLLSRSLEDTRYKKYLYSRLKEIIGEIEHEG